MAKYTTDMSQSDPHEEVARLKKELADANSRLAAGSAQSYTAQTEIDAGLDDEGNQRWWYVIQLPPSGGEGIKINGMEGKVFYHGERYCILTDTLRSLKEMVHRAWQQEDLIHGQNENFYRQQSSTSMNTGRRVAL